MWKEKNDLPKPVPEKFEDVQKMIADIKKTKK